MTVEPPIRRPNEIRSAASERLGVDYAYRAADGGAR